MNTFALEIFDDEGKKCTFYTVRWDDIEVSETEKFFSKFRQDADLKPSLLNLAKFIEIVIGDEKGAIEAYFRFENTADGLPPSKKFRIEKQTINFGNRFPLRLYCLRLSDELVILFNGERKTSQSAQDGDTSMVFHDANVFAERILKAKEDGEIIIKGRIIQNYNGSTDEILIY
ncbi:hypothetical protein WAF17_02400 [Bernardetia sp. ABR2-2B]|uniref:hypothetical protein n=1 Tax=Bernardetia sp. ABR2-2B TaxID=3127472 RepID=UPI0030CDB739